MVMTQRNTPQFVPAMFPHEKGGALNEPEKMMMIGASRSSEICILRVTIFAMGLGLLLLGFGLGMFASYWWYVIDQQRIP